MHCQVLAKAVSLCTATKCACALELIGRLWEGKMGSNVYVDWSKVLTKYFYLIK